MSKPKINKFGTISFINEDDILIDGFEFDFGEEYSIEEKEIGSLSLIIKKLELVREEYINNCSQTKAG